MKKIEIYVIVYPIEFENDMICSEFFTSEEKANKELEKYSKGHKVESFTLNL